MRSDRQPSPVRPGAVTPLSTHLVGPALGQRSVTRARPIGQPHRVIRSRPTLRISPWRRAPSTRRSSITTRQRGRHRPRVGCRRRLSAHIGRAAGTRQLGERRRTDGIDAIYVSDLERALETVRIAFAGSDVPIVVDPTLARVAIYGRFRTACPSGGAPTRSVLQRIATSLGRKGRATSTSSPAPASCSARSCPNATEGVSCSSHQLCQSVAARAPSLDGRDLRPPADRQTFAWQPGWEFNLGSLPRLGYFCYTLRSWPEGHCRSPRGNWHRWSYPPAGL